MPPQAPEPIVNRCPECEQEIDVSELSPYSKISCPHCAETIRVRTMLGAFHLTKLLGEGGMSQVFLAVDSTLNREVALKVLHRSLTQDAALTAMFEREAKLTALINHSNVVRVFTVGEDQGYFFIAMELVDNVSLEEKISGQGQIREAEVLEIAYDVSLGLRAAFQAGLIHRDIKPGNVLLTREGTAKLVDFGLALAHGGEDEVEEVWATPFYVPPEKLDGEPDDFRGDIYSLGAALFHALSGHPPFEANTASMQELKEIKAKPLHLKDAASHVSPKVAKLVDKMMCYKPSGRHQSYDELIGEIGELIEATTGGAGRGGRKVAEPKQSSKLTMRLVAVGIPVVAIGLGIAVYQNRPGNNDDGNSPLISVGEERLLGSGATAAAQFGAAREALIAGNFETAHSSFAKLLATEDLKQSTRSWTRFNTALSLLLRGEEQAARPLFADLATDDGFPDTDDAQAEKRLLQRLGQLCAEPLPVMEDDARADFDAGSIECIGFLICGLKNWNAGEFESGGRFLSLFLGAKAPQSSWPRQYSWIPKYQSLVSPYLDDLEVVRDLPRPQRSMPPAELEAMQKKLTLSLAALRTEGAAPDFARSRLDRARQFFTEPAPGPPPTTVVNNSGGENNGGTDGPGMHDGGSSFPNAAALAEMEKVRAMAEGMVSLTRQYRFAEAASQWQGTQFETVEARNRAGLENLSCQRAEDFLGGVITWFARGEYEGVVQRREGVPLDAKITAADRDIVIVDLGFGPNRVAVAELDPAWLLQTAREKVMSGSGVSPESRPEVWTQAAWFARNTGLIDQARELAGEVMLFSDPFRKNWEYLSREDGGADAGSNPGTGATANSGSN